MATVEVYLVIAEVEVGEVYGNGMLSGTKDIYTENRRKFDHHSFREGREGCKQKRRLILVVRIASSSQCSILRYHKNESL